MLQRILKSDYHNSIKAATKVAEALEGFEFRHNGHIIEIDGTKYQLDIEITYFLEGVATTVMFMRDSKNDGYALIEEKEVL